VKEAQRRDVMTSMGPLVLSEGRGDPAGQAELFVFVVEFELVLK